MGVKIRFLTVILLVLSLLSCSKKNNTHVDVNKIDVVVGTMGINALEEIEAYKPFVEYLNSLKSLNAYNFKVVAFTNLEQMKSSLQKGETDIYIDSPYPTIRIMDETNLEIVFNRMKGGVKEYQSLIFVHKESDINSITDLVGKVIAFEDPASTSSFYLPKSALISEGLQCEEYSGVTSNDSLKVSYMFSNDDANTALWVYIKKVDAGSTNDIAYERFPPKYRENFKVIYRTQMVPRHLLSWRSELDSTLKTVLGKELLSMHTTDEGRKSLEEFENTGGFEKITDITETITLFQSMKEVK